MSILKEVAQMVGGKIDDTKKQLVDATGKVELVIKLNVGLIVIVSILIIVLLFKKKV